MKTFLIILLFSCSINVFSAMTENDYLRMLDTSRDMLDTQNMEIKLGELTGAGRTVPLQNLEVIFTKDDYILRNEIQEFVLHEGQQTVSGIKEIYTYDGLIKSNEVDAIIFKK